MVKFIKVKAIGSGEHIISTKRIIVVIPYTNSNSTVAKSIIRVKNNVGDILSSETPEEIYNKLTS